jgi:hypothetical protein
MEGGIMVRTFFLAALLAASTVWGQIDVPTDTPPYQPIVARLRNPIPEGAQIQGGWTLSSAAFLPAAGCVHVWAPPGRHSIAYRGIWIKTRPITIDGQVVQVLEGFGFIDESATFKVGGGPDPGPDPPVPPPSQRWALVVEETSQRTPQQAALLTKLRSEYQSRLVIADKDSTASKLRAYINQVPSTMPLPALVVASMDGVLIRVVPLPATVEAFRKELAR